MKSIKLFLLILAMLGLLFCASCNKQLKTISDLVSGLPTEEGEHWEIGEGWDTGFDDPAGWQVNNNFGAMVNGPIFGDRTTEDKIDPHITKLSTDTVICHYIISNRPVGRVIDSMNAVWFKKLVLESDGYYASSDSSVIQRTQETNTEDGYIRVTFEFLEPGLYICDFPCWPGQPGYWMVVQIE